jgi:hypothetical protein
MHQSAPGVAHVCAPDRKRVRPAEHLALPKAELTLLQFAP